MKANENLIGQYSRNHWVIKKQTESQPITNSDGGLPLERLMEVLEVSQERMVAGLDRATPATLAMSTDQENQRTTEQQIAFHVWHKTYHVGQLEILRQLTGADDAII